MPRLVLYQDLRETVRDGDLLLWRPTSLPGRMIRLGSSLVRWKWIPYSHASMAAWGQNGRLYNLEQIQWLGSQHKPLSKLLARYPGSCEIWRPVDPSFDGQGAVRQMLWLMGQHYGWSTFPRIILRTTFPGLLAPAENSDDPDQPLVCSSAYSFAARTGGGIAPCPQKPDVEVSPADLALSGFARYHATPVL